MTLPTKPYKGSRDFYPEDKRLQKHLFKTMSTVCESFGYQEYDASMLEPTELYLTKGNEEIINEQTYTFTDRGNRQVTLRTEMTPSVARMVAGKAQELAFPARWYSIPQCWRYERMQRGRGREFYQLNVDIFGVAGVTADHEIVMVADSLMIAYGAKRNMYTIKLNSRKLTNYILQDYLGFDAVEAATIIRLVDRMHKMDEAAFVALLDGAVSPSQKVDGSVDKLMDVLKVKNFAELPEVVKQHTSALEIMQLMDMLAASEVTNAQFDPSLMRGFDYYTDIVFEMFDTHPDNNRSMGGGGRYDGLTEMFGVTDIPVAGLGMGDYTLLNFLEVNELVPSLKTETDLGVVLVGDVYNASLSVVTELRQMGLNVAMGDAGRKTEKQIKSFDKDAVRYVLFIGESELASQQYSLKNLDTGESKQLSLQRVVSEVKDYRN